MPGRVHPVVHQRLGELARGVAACKSQLATSARRLRECLELQSDVTRRYFRLGVYAGELRAEDTGKPASLALRQRLQVLGTRFTEAVMDAFFGQWKKFERTLGVAYYGNLKEGTVYTRVRKYPDSLTRALDGNRVPREVYDTLIKSVNANLPTLHRSFRLRAKMLGVAQMRYYDINLPLLGGGREYPIDEGVQMMLDAVKPLGPDYGEAMKKGVAARWMDVYPRPRKQSGAHMAGSAYDVHPYLLLNYTNNYESVSTLAHEWGHAMHAHLSNKTQPFPTAGYPIFTRRPSCRASPARGRSTRSCWARAVRIIRTSW